MGTLESKLFRRLPRGVELTEARAGFLNDARDVLARLDGARVEARRRSAGQLGRLRIGFAGATYLVPAVTQTMLAYRTQFPGVALLPEQSNTPALIEGLLTGRLDAAFIRPPIVVDEPLSEQPVGEEPMIVALPTGHRLAKRKTIDLADIDGDTVILFPREIGPGLYDTIVTALREANVTLSLWQSAPQIQFHHSAGGRLRRIGCAEVAGQPPHGWRRVPQRARGRTHRESLARLPQP